MRNVKAYYDAAQAAHQLVEAKADEIDALFNQGKTEDALKLSPELTKLKADAKAADQLYLEMSEPINPDDPARHFVRAGGDQEPKEIADLRKSPAYMDSFFKAFRAGVTPKSINTGASNAESYKVLMDALSETGGSPAGSEGGFLLPIDFDAMIHEQKRQAIDLSPFVNVEPVQMFSGWRAVEVAAAALPFAEITESDFPAGERIKETESPTFKRVDFTLKKYGGYLPISSDLLSDTPAAIMKYLAKWCGRKLSLTNTSLIMAILSALSPVSVTDYKKVFGAIKTALNLTLDPAISVSSIVLTNQTGFDLLDQMVDGTGRPMLAPDPTNETVKRFKGRQIVELSDAQLPNLSTNTYVPIFVGDPIELVTLFERSAGEMSTTNIGGDAWRNDNTEVKYTTRKVAKAVDTAAVSYLKVTLPA